MIPTLRPHQERASLATRESLRRRVHAAPCKHCPSAHYPPDPESEDIRLNYAREDQLASLFLCGWRKTAICRGQYDELQVTEAELATYELAE